ncbi:EVI2B protein, partial [Podargus strigoides]|nr:EVI2B protein [Podargus strigoides]
MASNRVILLLCCGEIWKALSTATPHNVPMSQGSAHSSIRRPTGDKAPLYPLRATGPSLQRSGRALTVTTPTPFPDPYAEPSDGSWTAALLIGIILISMIMAIIVILLWKCCKRPVVVDSNWAGRSPFADGDTPDVCVDSDQAPKRSSVLFMLPWKLKQETDVQHHPTASEKPPHCTTSTESSPVPPPVEDCSITSIPPANASPAPTSEAASSAHNSCPHPPLSPQPPDLPPPPDWLREPTEDSSDPSKYQEFHSETEEQLPPPPESLLQEIHEPLPQSEHPF